MSETMTETLKATTGTYAWNILQHYDAADYVTDVEIIDNENVIVSCVAVRVGFGPRIVRSAFLSEGCDVETVDYPGNGPIRLAVRLS